MGLWANICATAGACAALAPVQLDVAGCWCVGRWASGGRCCCCCLWRIVPVENKTAVQLIVSWVVENKERGGEDKEKEALLLGGN
jgi:hypothetical protein